MMISPEGYADSLIDKSYEELIVIREELIEEIHIFENEKVINDELYMLSPSPDVIYQCNHLYLAKLCELIPEKYVKSLWEKEV